MLLRLAQLLAGLLIAKTVFTVLRSYGDYFPANFRAEFLMGREAYFYGAYETAFYVHILAGPLVLLSGLVLLSETVRRCWPQGHRTLGRIHVGCVLLLVAPSGLWMARYAEPGDLAVAGFATSAIATGACAVMGWRCAVQKQFGNHRRWMLRCYALLCSAVVIRVVGGATAVLHLEGNDALTAWLAWIVPLLALEVFFTSRRPVVLSPR